MPKKLPIKSLKDLDKVFQELKAKKAQEEAFELVGKPYTKEGVLVGEAGPISRPPVPFKSVPTVIPEPKTMPVVDDVTGQIIDVPFTVVDDASSATTQVMTNPSGITKPGISAYLKSIGIGAGIGSVGGMVLPRDKVFPDEPEALTVDLTKTPENTSQIKPNDKLQEQKDKIGKILAKSASNTQPINIEKKEDNVIDFGEGSSIASLDALKQAQASSNDAVFANQIARIGAAMASQMGGTKNAFDDAIADQIEQAKSLPQQYKEQVQFEKEDPNSPMSKGYRDLAKRLGFNIKGTASAADLERLMPQLANVYNQQEAQKARKETAEIMAQERASSASERADTKKELEQNKFIERASDKLAKRTEAFNKIKKASAMIDEAVKDPSAIKDVTALYSFISALDPTSVVREGEIGLAKSAGGLIGRMETALSQMSKNPKLINSKSLKDIRLAIKQLEALNDQEYGVVRQQYFTQAKARGVSEDRFNEIDPFYKAGQVYQVPKVEQLSTKPVKSTKGITIGDVDSMSDEEVEEELRKRGL